MQSCVDSIRNNDPSLSSSGAGDNGLRKSSAQEDSPEALRLQEQLDDFLRVHTSLVEELVELLQEMNECISSNDTSSKEAAKIEEKEKDEESKEEEVVDAEKAADDQSADQEQPAAEEPKIDDAEAPAAAEVEKAPETEESKTEPETKEEDAKNDDDKDKYEADNAAGEQKEKTEGDATTEEDKSAKEVEKNVEGTAENEDDGTSELKFKLMEMNSQLRNWGKRIESIIERCATLQPQISVFPS